MRWHLDYCALAVLLLAVALDWVGVTAAAADQVCRVPREADRQGGAPCLPAHGGVMCGNERCGSAGGDRAVRALRRGRCVCLSDCLPDDD